MNYKIIISRHLPKQTSREEWYRDQVTALQRLKQIKREWEANGEHVTLFPNNLEIQSHRDSTQSGLVGWVTTKRR